MRPHPARCLCRLAARQKMRESNRFRGAPTHGEVARSDEADSGIRRLQLRHGHRPRTHRASPGKKQYGPCRHADDLLIHGDDRPPDGYEPMAQRASIRTPRRGPADENMIACHTSVSLSIYPSTVPLSSQSVGAFRTVQLVRVMHQTNQKDRTDRMNQTNWRTFSTSCKNKKGGRSSKPLPPFLPIKPFVTYSAAGYSADRALRS